MTVSPLPDRWMNGNVERRVDALRPGDRINLEADVIADPDYFETGDPLSSEHPEFQFEFQIVKSVEQEDSDCIRVDFESGFSCGFPPDHWLDVDGEQIREGI